MPDQTQQLRMPCPECKQQHDNPKQTECCVIAALNRYLISFHYEWEHAQAHLQWFNVMRYYQQVLLRDNQPRTAQEVTVLADQPDVQGEIYGKSLFESAYSSIAELRHMKVIK